MSPIKGAGDVAFIRKMFISQSVLKMLVALKTYSAPGPYKIQNAVALSIREGRRHTGKELKM
jgi:hypothetical protein